MASLKRVLVAGGTGLIGKALVAHLRDEKKLDVVVLTRGKAGVRDRVTYVYWSPGSPLTLPASLAEARIDAVINLAGESIASLPWTQDRRNRILKSRLDATGTLIDWMRGLETPPTVFVSGSAVGFYGNRGEEELDESSTAGAGFLADVTREWEALAADAPSATRTVFARTGLVVADGGAMSPLRLLTGLLAGGPLGEGKAWWPWISLNDEVRALTYLLSSKLSGAVNLVGPSPARSEELGRKLAQLMHRPFWLRAPAFAIRRILGQGGEELLLSSQKVLPTRLLDDGFVFEETNVEQALSRIL